MKVRVFYWFVFASHALLSHAQEFEIELWPGEGRPIVEIQSSQVTLRELPSQLSPILENIEVSVGTAIKFGDTRYKTVKPGLITARVQSRIQGRDLGEIKTLSMYGYYRNPYPQLNLEMTAGQSFEYLQYRAEGTCFVRIEQKVIVANLCPAVMPGDFRVNEEPVVELWVLANLNGSEGWVLVDGEHVRVTGREF